MRKILISFLLLSSISANSALLLPKDYESSNKFFKVDSETTTTGRTLYKFYECTGNIVKHTCETSFDEAGYSKSELNSLEKSEVVKGSGLLMAEVVTGGIIWKRLMKFTLSKAAKIAGRVMNSTEGVANATVALAVMGPSNAGVTVYALNKANQLLDVIDPFARFERSELIDTDEYEAEDGIVPLSYEHEETYVILEDLLSNIQ